MIQGLHHVQLAMPQGEEERAKAFYIYVLGFKELEKPTILKDRGGVWFLGAGVELHLGVEQPFAPAKKAHPAFQVASLKQAMERLSDQGIDFLHDVDLPTLRRIYIDDPFGNRIELLETT